MTDLPVKPIMELLEAEELTGEEWFEVVQLGNSRRFHVIPRVSPRLFGEPEVPTGDGSNPEMIVNFEALQAALDEMLGVPAKPTAVALNSHTAIDEDGKTHLYVLVTFTPVPGMPRAHYEIKYSDDNTHYPGFETKDPEAAFLARSGILYRVKVRTISPEGVASDWTDILTITPSKKSVLPTTPSGLSAVGGSHRNKLFWDRSEDRDYQFTKIFSSTTDNFLTAELVGSIHGDDFIDEDLANKQTYYYWIVHVDRSGNESNKFPVTNVGGISATTKLIKDDDTDDTAPNAPTALSVTQRTKLDDDGKIVLYLILTWNAPSGASAKVNYEIKIVDDDGDLDREFSKDRRKRIAVRSGVAYDLYVRAVTFNNVNGPWSTVLTVTPDKKLTLPIAPVDLVVDAGFKHNKLSWTKSTEKDFKEAVIYRADGVNNFASSSEVGRSSSTVFIDSKLTNGTNYYYWITFVDRTRNESNRWPSGATAGIVGQPLRVADDDTDGTAPGTPTSFASVQRTYLDEDGKSVLDIILTWNAPAGATGKTHYEIYVDDGTDTGNLKSKDRHVRVPVRSGVAYNFGVRALTFNDIPGSYATLGPITPNKKSIAPTTAAGLTVNSNHKRNKLHWTPCPDTDYKLTNIYRSLSNSFPGAGGLIDSIKGSVALDDNIAIGTQYYYWVAHVDRSGNIGTASSSATDTIPSIIEGDTDSTAPSTPSSANLALSQVQRRDKDGPIKSYLRGVFTTTGYSAKTSFKFNVSDGTNVFTVDSQDGKFHWPAEVGLTYSVTVVAISFAGQPSSASSSMTKLITGKVADITTPGGLAIIASHKRNHVSWTDVDDDLFPDYAITYLYRNTSNTTPTPGVTVPFKKTKAGYYSDSVDNSTTYYYWVAHKDNTGNFTSVAGPVSGNGQVIFEVDTDSTAPATPNSANLTLSQVQRRDRDGSIKTYLRGVFTTTGYSAKTNYKFNVNDGTNSFSVNSKDGVFHHPAEVALTYVVSVVAISFSGVASTASGTVSKLITKKGADIANPAGLAAAGNSKRTKIDWTDVDDDTYPDYAITYIWRQTSTVTPPTPGVTAPYKKSKAGYYLDDNLTIGTVYYYWIAHKDSSGNFTALSGPVNSPATAIGDSDIDSSPPATPSSANLTLAQYQRRDKDGTIKTYLKAVFVTTGYASNVDYIFNIDDTVNAVYPIASKSGKAQIPVEVGLTYSVTVQAISFAGVLSTASSAVTRTTTKKANDVPSPAGLAISSAHKRNHVSWTDIDEITYPDYATTCVYRQTANTPVPTPGTTTPYKKTKAGYYADTALDMVTTYYYWIAHKDNSDNYSVVVGPVSGTGLVIVEGDTDSAVPGTPSSANLTLSQVQRRDRDGSIKTYLRGVFTTTGYSSKVSYKFNISDGTNTFTQDSQDGVFHCPAEVALVYSVTVQAISFSGVPSTASSAVTRTITKKANDMPSPAGLAIASAHKRNHVSWTDIDDDTYPDYMTTCVYRQTANTPVPTPGTTTPYKRTKAGYLADTALDMVTTYYYWIAHKDKSGNFSVAVGPVSGTGLVIVEGDTDSAVPGTPSSANLTLSQIQRRDRDGPIKTYVRGVFTTTGYSSKISYKFNISDGTNTFTQDSQDGVFHCPAEIGLTYSVTVQAISFAGIPSIASGAVTKTPIKKTSDIPAAPSLNITSDIRGNRLDWAHVDDDTYPDYMTTCIYRNTGSATPAPTPGTTAPYKRTKGNSFNDRTITAPTVYYYWIAHKDTSGNFSGLTGPTSSAPDVITSSDTDGVVLSAPANLTASQTAKNVDTGDGRVDIGVQWDWDAVTNAKSYAVSVTEDGSIVHSVNVGLRRRFKYSATIGHTYGLTVRAVAWDGTQGTDTSEVTKTPVKKSALPSTPAGLSATKQSDTSWLYGKIALEWNMCNDNDYDYTLVQRNSDGIYANGVTDVKKVKGDGWTDNKLGNAVTRYYWIVHVDRSGNSSARFPTGTGVTGIRGDTRRLATDDVDTGGIKEGNVGKNAIINKAFGNVKSGNISRSTNGKTTVTGLFQNAAHVKAGSGEKKCSIVNPNPSPIFVGYDLRVGVTITGYSPGDDNNIAYNNTGSISIYLIDDINSKSYLIATIPSDGKKGNVSKKLKGSFFTTKIKAGTTDFLCRAVVTLKRDHGNTGTATGGVKGSFTFIDWKR